MNSQTFSKIINLIILFFGGLTLASSIILLTVWLPQLKGNIQKLGLDLPVYPYVILPLVVFLSIIQMVLGFIIDKRRTSAQPLSKSYLIVALILLMINLILVLGVFITIRQFALQ